jgi:hypothetical protein
MGATRQQLPYRLKSKEIYAFADSHPYHIAQCCDEVPSPQRPQILNLNGNKME